MEEIAIIENLGNHYFQRLVKEYKERDNAMIKGQFARDATNESVLRYWLEESLFYMDFNEIQREYLYSYGKTENSKLKVKLNSKSGRTISCDICAYWPNSELETWLEMKTAYSNTKYKVEELTKDMARLDKEVQYDSYKIYLIVSISQSKEPYPKLENVVDFSKQVGFNLVFTENESIDIPSDWQWQNGYLRLDIFLKR